MTEPLPDRRRSCRVVKVGGSLLTLPRLECALIAWWRHQESMPTLLVVGGGELADAVRALDRSIRLEPDTAHWMAIRAMQVHAFVLCQTLDCAEWVTDCCHWLKDSPSTHGDRLGVVAVEEFLRTREPHEPGVPLPVGWQVTSDSIAARLAQVVGATELVLLKSTLPERNSVPLSIAEAVALQLVDEHFPRSAAELPRIRIVNLRAAERRETSLVW